MDNLALACPLCNAYKWAFTVGTDKETGEPARLFNPREDVWAEHFRWSANEPGLLEGLTAIGRATISRLRMNDSLLLTARRLSAALNLAADAAG